MTSVGELVDERGETRWLFGEVVVVLLVDRARSASVGAVESTVKMSWSWLLVWIRRAAATELVRERVICTEPASGFGLRRPGRRWTRRPGHLTAKVGPSSSTGLRSGDERRADLDVAGERLDGVASG